MLTRKPSLLWRPPRAASPGQAMIRQSKKRMLSKNGIDDSTPNSRTGSKAYTSNSCGTKLRRMMSGRITSTESREDQPEILIFRTCVSDERLAAPRRHPGLVAEVA